MRPPFRALSDKLISDKESTPQWALNRLRRLIRRIRPQVPQRGGLNLRPKLRLILSLIKGLIKSP
jgi:hypothetical protein